MDSVSAPTAQTSCASIDQHLLHRLDALQQQFRHIPAAEIPKLATELCLPISQIEAVIDFYSFFHRTPRGRFDILFSNCTSCGDLSMMDQLCERLNVQPGITRDDAVVSIDSTSCIGMCDQGPALLINGQTMTQLSHDRLNQMAELINSDTSLEQWPSDWFDIHDNIHREDLLLSNTLEAGTGLRAAIERGSDNTLEEITTSGLRGRGGAGFGTGMKWRFCRQAQPTGSNATRYVICNADEGEPGTFKDRILLTHHAHAVFEGMTICGFVIGASKGFLYLRGEYRYLLPELRQILKERRQTGLLGENILGQNGFSFEIDIVLGAGAYICGEESALIESLEQKRGTPRVRPPFPVTQGFLGQPTVVNNVETLTAAAHIAIHGGDWLVATGSDQSSGSKILSVSGDCSRPGIYEYPFGVSIQQILDDCGAEDVQAVQVGGPSGTLIAPDQLERKLGFEDLATGGSMMIYSHQRDLLSVVQNFSHFFAHESCGFCTPCRVGTTLLKKNLDKIASGHGTPYDVDEMQRLAKLVKQRSHCGLGQTAPNPILDLLERFPNLIEEKLAHAEFEPQFDLDGSLSEARQLTHRNDAEAHLS